MLDNTKDNSATEIEIAQTIGAAATDFNAGELADIAYGAFEAIADAISEGPEAVGRIIMEARKQWIADAASRAIYGRVGVIKSEKVKV